MRIVNWNIERRGPQTWQAKSLLSQIESLEPDLVCLTEARETSLGAMAGHTLSHRGYRLKGKAEDERLVVLWSKAPWEALAVPDVVSGGGGAILGRTQIAGKPIACLGLCIPYHMARMDGEDKAKPWHWHKAFLGHLEAWLPELARVYERLIVMGDFNQRIPRRFGSRAAFDLLVSAFAPLRFITEGALEPLSEQTIDHIAVAGGLKEKRVIILDRHDGRGKARSDHHGIFADMAVR